MAIGSAKTAVLTLECMNRKYCARLAGVGRDFSVDSVGVDGLAAQLGRRRRQQNLYPFNVVVPVFRAL